MVYMPEGEKECMTEGRKDENEGHDSGERGCISRGEMMDVTEGRKVACQGGERVHNKVGKTTVMRGRMLHIAYQEGKRWK